MERIGGAVAPEHALPVAADRPAAPGAGSFGGELSRAIAAVEGLQLEADRQAALSASGAGNLHETALALEKADVAMRLATRVRNKLVEAYQETMRMSV